MNDIVNALRMRCDDDSCVMLCQTAADEIERLRTHCDEWASIAEELMKWSNAPAVDWQHEMYKKSINRYFKAVHDGL